jgi:hypothetical protein
MPEMHRAMRVSETGIKRRLHKWGTHSSAVILVKADHGNDDPFEVVAATVALANDVLHEGDEARVLGENVFRSAKGIMFFLVAEGSDDDVLRWLEILRDTLERRGWHGTLLTPSLSWYPERAWRFRDSHAPWVGHIAMTQTRRTTQTYGGTGWLVNGEITKELTTFATKWVSTISGTSYFSGGTAQIKVGPAPPPADLLATAVRRCGQSYVSMLALNPLTERSANLTFGAQVEFSAKGVEEEWRTSIAAVRQPLISLGHAADYAAVSHAIDYNVQSAGRARGLGELVWRGNRHLWSTYVPEAFGIQVLTKSHLERASDLSGWHISPIGDDRYVVEAHDLEPWYSTPNPASGARIQAREDFGNLLLTDAAVRADPHGWVQGDPLRQLFLE